MFFQHDDAPPHTSIRARRILDESYPDRWIDRRGVINWPASSPNLTPLDCFLQSTIKEYIYREHINNREELQEKIIGAFAIVN